MYRISIEKKYIVKKGDKRVVIELCRSQDGKMFVVPMYITKHVYVASDGSEKEWEYDAKDAEEIDYMALPQNVREALSKAGI